MGDQFFEVFKPKSSDEEDDPGAERAVASPGVEALRPPSTPRPEPVEQVFGGLPQAAGLPRPARSGDEKVIALRFEEVVVFLIGAMMLMVIAFLLGWYGHERSAGTPLVSGQGQPEAPALDERLAEFVPTNPPATAVEPRSSSPRVEESSAPAAASSSGPSYSLEVIRYPQGDMPTARRAKEKLEARGYAPVFILRRDRELGVFVGKFDSKDDPRVEKWQREIKALSRAYKWCEVKLVQ